MKTIREKLDNLKEILQKMESVLIGYSGGVDSTFLAKIAVDVLGDKALCVTAVSESYPEHERLEAEQFADQLGLRCITVKTKEMDDENYRKNDARRCYYCKKAMISDLKRIAREQGCKSIIIGTNYDDLGDYRPGQQAAKEEGIRSPLMEVQMTKEDIRVLSKEMGIPTWNKPSFACLSSRIPYGQQISSEVLSKIDRAEAVLRAKGFKQFRVRHHETIARIEILPGDMEKLLLERLDIYEQLRRLGYSHVTMDLLGYRTGSMNEIILNNALPVINA